MSNKTDLQTLNAQYESLIQTLSGKAAGGGSGGGSSGSELKIATGTVQLPEQVQLLTNPITVSGLDFTPKYVSLSLNGSAHTNNGHFELVSYDSSTAMGMFCRYYNNKAYFSRMGMSCSMEDDGFTISLLNGGTASNYYVGNVGNFNYCAIG